VKVSNKKVFLLVILVVLIAVGFIYKWLDENRLFVSGESTATGLLPFKPHLYTLSISTSEGRFHLVFTNTLNETVSVTKLNLTNIECSYGHRSTYKKIKCWFLYSRNPSCSDKYKLKVDGIDFDKLPVVVGPNKEFSIEFLACEALKNKNVGDKSWVDLSIDYQIGNKTFSTWGRVGTFYE